MNRKYSKEGYIALAERLREARPDIVITTDLMVGFPGETDADFEETRDLIERVRFDSAFTFLFSPRKGTPAAGYEDLVPEAVKQERFDRMVKRLNEITLEKNRAYVGSVQEVLVEGPSKTGASMLAGRTCGGKLVNFPAPARLAPPTALPGAGKSAAFSGEAAPTALVGAIVPVRIIAVKTFSFTGELLPL
jgi:tRNA-2-methylthio-N6-dimethylallyladenosine synthase